VARPVTSALRGGKSAPVPVSDSLGGDGGGEKRNLWMGEAILQLGGRGSGRKYENLGGLDDGCRGMAISWGDGKNRGARRKRASMETRFL
jgi:hypothetical protein